MVILLIPEKEVPKLAELGFPFADVKEDGTAIITKVEGTGGVINSATVKEQLLYEVTNPHQYITPDVIADFTSVHLQEIKLNQIQVSGGTGITRPETLKVSVGYEAGVIGEGEISYAGSNALERAKLAGEILYSRLKDKVVDLRIDYIGISSVHRVSFQESDPYEIRLRVAGKCLTLKEAAKIGEEVEALYTNGPAGGGGARKYVNEVVGIVSTLISRNKIETYFTLKESITNEKEII